MKPFRSLSVVLFLAVPAVAHAQINLAWNSCITQSSAAANIQYACDGSRNGDPFKLVASFIPPNTLPGFVGGMLIIDVSMPGADPPLPDWWRYQKTFPSSGIPECRDGNLAFPASNTGVGSGSSGACQNPWLGAFTGGGLQYNNHGDEASGIFAGDHDKARILVSFARSSPFMLVGNQQYHWGAIEMDSYGDVATEDHSVCQGCCQPVLITLVRVELDQEAGSPGGDVNYFTTPATRNYVWWQQNGCNGAVPVRKSSWGAIKATYR
jgi:hypothetical protein